jgi:probable rRNA maturation factor
LETISFNNNGISPRIRLTKELKYFLTSIFKSEKILFRSVSYVFCTDDYLLALNQQYLNHDTLTDVLTFTLSDTGSPVVAEIYISIERIQENAAFLKMNYSQELLRVMIHGILHLCGYLDLTPKQKTLIRKKEDHYLALLGST